MTTNKNIPYYLAAAVVFVLLKFGYAQAGNGDLIFLLKPTDKLIGILTDSVSSYTQDIGYYHQKLNIIIDKSCSGFNLGLICFLMLFFLMLRHFNEHSYRFLAFPIILCLSYVLTIFINTSRIFASLVVQNQGNDFLAKHQHIVHESIGIITNLTFLILVYYTAEKVLIKRQSYATPA